MNTITIYKNFIERRGTIEYAVEAGCITVEGVEKFQYMSEGNFLQMFDTNGQSIGIIELDSKFIIEVKVICL